MELSGLVAHHARYRPNVTAVIFDGRKFDYRTFNARINRVAHLLRTLGVGKGERVATLLPNTLELLELYWACARIGAVAVPLSPLLTGAGLSGLIKDAGAVCLVTRNSLLPTVAAVLPELPTLSPERVLLIDGAVPPWGDYAARAAAPPRRRTPGRPTPASAPTTSSTSCTPRAPPACPRASCTAIACARCTRCCSAPPGA